MQKWIAVILLILCGSGNVIAQGSYADHVKDYVARYKDLAMLEQQRSGVPASITLGQGVLETQAGESVLCTDANNHFGIKCRKEWTGETFAHDDDRKDECFRKYKCVQDSYKDHSDYLLSSPRYAPLFELKKTDYTGWAKGLKRCGYATNPVYAFQLIKIIEDFELQTYTVAALNGTSATPKFASAEVIPDHDTPARGQTPDTLNISAEAKAHPYMIQQVNGLQAFFARKGDVLLEHAIKNNIRYAKLLELNDLPDAPLEADMPIYLVKKHSQGKHEKHTLQDGETLLQVAQAEGMSLKQLALFNQLKAKEQPVPGTVLYLQENAPAKPALVAVARKTETKTPQANTTSADEYIVKDKVKADSPIIATNATQEVVPGPDVVKAKEEPVAVPREEPVVVKEQPVPVAEEKAITEPVKPEPAKPTEQAATSSKEQKTGYTITLDTAAAPAPPVSKTADTPVIVTAPGKAETITPVQAPVENKPEAKVETAPVVVEEKVNTPPPPPVVEKKPETVYNIPDRSAANAEPQDEFAKLRAKMDRVVYAVPPTQPAKNNTSKTANTKANTATVKGPEPEIVPQAAGDDADKYYTVKKGDTGFSIAKKNHITMAQLRAWNKLDFEAITPGKKLQVKP